MFLLLLLPPGVTVEPSQSTLSEEPKKEISISSECLLSSH